MDLGLKDRVVVVAGGDDADRRACVTLLATEGAIVMESDTLAGGADAVARALSEHGRVEGVAAFLPDVAGRNVIDAEIEALYESWSAVEAVAAAFRAAVPSMSDIGWGRLVSVTTGAVKWLDDGIDELGVMAGLGVLGLHKAAVADIAQFGIATNAVLRGADCASDEIAATVAFLLSNDAEYLQGVTISLDGAISPAVY
ncbi:MAG: hypothetical protein AB7V43_06210 [Acidimicrobiia bacterium]